MLKQQRADHLLCRLQELYPETPIPLDHTDAFTLLIAVLLSAQCTDVRVNLVTPALFALADNPRDMMAVPVEEIRAIIRPCGLSPRKSAAISGLSNNPLFPALRTGPTAASGASPQKQITSSHARRPATHPDTPRRW